ncbi:MAG: hypothetical protein VX044_04025 [Planctomycetota bacterium]|nr:hypothetical protein [Planctomycetota bacterium]MEC8651103.1 hypothetical protein [Planctomycetota bacterium]
MAWLAAACVVTYEPAEPVDGREALPFAAPVSIPLPELGGAGGSRVQVEFFSGILRRLQDAAEEARRSPESALAAAALIDGLVESYDKPGVPQAFERHLEGYRAIARGIRFQEHVRRSAQLRMVDPQERGRPPAEGAQRAPALGAPLALELELPPMERPVLLGARSDRDPVGFAVAVTIRDEYVDGSTREFQTKDFLRLGETYELAGERALRLPVRVEAAVGEAVRRSVVVRVDLMPGYVTLEGLRAPIQRVTAGAITCTQWPAGYEILAAQPLAGLRAALKDFNPKNFASAYLSALLVPSRDRLEATALLIDQVRFGRADQAQVAMAALHKTAGVQVAIGDRDGWLEWWQSRQ